MRYKTIPELEAALELARDDVRDATAPRRNPEVPSAKQLRLREAAHKAWVAMEEAKKLPL
jgi:hypothetical protein